MIVRDILDKDNNKLGEMTFPDGTSEEVIAAKLNVYKSSVPLSDVTPRQIRLALLLSGVLLSDIEAALNSLPEPVKSYALIEWEYSLAFKRVNPLVEQVGQLLGWTSGQLDNLWKTASTL